VVFYLLNTYLLQYLVHQDVTFHCSRLNLLVSLTILKFTSKFLLHVLGTSILILNMSHSSIQSLDLYLQHYPRYWYARLVVTLSRLQCVPRPAVDLKTQSSNICLMAAISMFLFVVENSC